MSYSPVQEDTINAKKGSYITGALGAILGALIGAIPWAVVYFLGYFSGWLALIISFCAVKGYQLLRGKDRAAKYAIVVLAIILGAVFGCISGEFAVIGKMINDGELIGTFMDIPSFYFDAWQDAEYRNASIMDFVIGLAFAGAGAIYFARMWAQKQRTIESKNERLEA